MEIPGGVLNLAEGSPALMSRLALQNPSARELYRASAAMGVRPEDLVEVLKHESFKAKQPLLAKSKWYSLPKLVKPNPATADYLKRSATELADFTARRGRRNRMIGGAGLAGILGLGAYLALSDKPEDKYKKEVERMMETMQLMRAPVRR